MTSALQEGPQKQDKRLKIMFRRRPPYVFSALLVTLSSYNHCSYKPYQCLSVVRLSGVARGGPDSCVLDPKEFFWGEVLVACVAPQFIPDLYV